MKISLLLALCAALALVAPGTAEIGSAAVPGELIVSFRTGVTEAERAEILGAAGAEQWEAVGDRHRLKLVRTEPADIEQALALLRGDPRVEYAEPNYRVSAIAIPDDPGFGQLWGLVNTGQDGGTPDADIDADAAWDLTTGSANVVVAVIDTGIDFGHPDLAPNRWTNAGETGGGKETNGVDDDLNGYVDDWQGWDFVNNDNDPLDDHGHGTHVAGTIGAVGGNDLGVAGVNWDVSLMALKFLDGNGEGFTADAVEAVRYATEMGAVVSNNSWGGADFSESLLDAIEEAGAAGSLFVAAAGNDTDDTDIFPHYPSSYEAANVVSVAATTRTDALELSFSNFGLASVDLGAPGLAIYSTVPDDGYATASGTSMAAPHVAGAAALAKAAFPTATAPGLKALLLRTVDTLAGLDGKVASGGRLNAGTAVGCSAKPQVWIDSPAASFDAGGDPIDVVVLAGVCGVPAGVVVEATVSGVPVPLTADGTGRYTGSFVPPAEGDVTLTAIATAGTETDLHTVSGDETPPSVAVTSPVEGAVVGGVVTLAAEAADNRSVSQVEFLVAGSVVGSDASSPYSISWTSSSVANGLHSITARATDPSGNAGLAPTRSVTVSNAPPAPPPSTGGGGGGVKADLALQGHAQPASVPPGSEVTLYLRVLNDKNRGVAQNVVVELDLPGGFVPVFTYADRGPGCGQPEGGKLRCHLDWLSADALVANVTIRLLATAAVEAAVAARVQHGEADPDPSDNAIVLRIAVAEQAVAEPEPDTAEPAKPQLTRIAAATLTGRRVVIRVVTARPSMARVVVTRRGKIVLRSKRRVRAGPNVIRLTLPRGLPRSGYRVTVRLGGGTKLTRAIKAR